MPPDYRGSGYNDPCLMNNESKSLVQGNASANNARSTDLRGPSFVQTDDPTGRYVPTSDSVNITFNDHSPWETNFEESMTVNDNLTSWSLPRSIEEGREKELFHHTPASKIVTECNAGASLFEGDRLGFLEGYTDELNDLTFRPCTASVEMDGMCKGQAPPRPGHDVGVPDQPLTQQGTGGSLLTNLSSTPLNLPPQHNFSFPDTILVETEIPSRSSPQKGRSITPTPTVFDSSQFRPPSLPQQAGYYDNVEDEEELLFHPYNRSSVEDAATTADGSPRPGGSEGPSCSSSYHAGSFPPSSQCSLPQGVKRSFGNGLIDPTSTAHDTFLDDPYAATHPRPCQQFNNSAHVQYPEDDPDDEAELSGLLTREPAQSNSYLNDWRVTDTQRSHHDSIQFNITKERLQGVHRIRSQLSQAAQVFRELAHLINEQQDDLDLLDHSIINAKHSSAQAIEELRKANRRKQRARRRSLFMMGIACIAALVVFLVYLVQTSSSTNVNTFHTPLAPPAIQGAAIEVRSPTDSAIRQGEQRSLKGDTREDAAPTILPGRASLSNSS